ncbi:MAG: carboxypeptidase M32 [Anaeromyxobacteraceae bacterium]
MPDPWDLLAARMADLRALQGAIAVLSWDHETHMPPKGGAARGEQLAALQGLRHEKLIAPDLGGAIAAAEEAERGAGDPTRTALLRAIRFERDRAIAVPERLVRETAAAQTASVAAWRTARERSDFAAFAPHLENVLALRREAAEHLLPTLAAAEGGAPPQRYDALLEGHEPGMRIARLEPLFRRLSSWLAPLADRLTAAGPPEDPLAGQRFEADAQWAFTVELLLAMGFDLAAGRQDRSTHPFTEGIDPCDVRLTNRVDPALPLSAIFSALHEGGHGLYEQGLPVEHRKDLLCAAPSMGLHESQSRLWENLVGRSRPFWSHFLPRLAAHFPAAAGVSLERFHRAVNQVERSLVRVEADEVTYNLHVILRFELEVALLQGDLRVGDLPAAWNERSARLLGVVPHSDAEGVLQDIHWAFGEFGYFPTYAIGNLYAATLFAAARRALPDLDDRLAQGQLASLGAWLREHVHRLGRALPAEEIVRRATGRGLGDEDFRAYLEAKYGA